MTTQPINDCGSAGGVSWAECISGGRASGTCSQYGRAIQSTGAISHCAAATQANCANRQPKIVCNPKKNCVPHSQNSHATRENCAISQRKPATHNLCANPSHQPTATPKKLCEPKPQLTCNPCLSCEPAAMFQMQSRSILRMQP